MTNKGIVLYGIIKYRILYSGKITSGKLNIPEIQQCDQYEIIYSDAVLAALVATLLGAVAALRKSKISLDLLCNTTSSRSQGTYYITT